MSNGDIRIEIPNINEVVRSMTAGMQHMQEACELAVARAINRTLDAMRAEAIRLARERYLFKGVAAGRVFDELYMRKCAKGGTKGTLHISGDSGMSLRHFSPSPNVPGKKPAQGVSAKVLRGGSRKVRNLSGYSKPFIMKKMSGKHDNGDYGVFVRKNGVNNFHQRGKRRGRWKNIVNGKLINSSKNVWAGVKMLFGASPIQVLQRKESQERIQQVAEQTFPKRLAHEIDALLAGVSRGKGR